MTASYGHEYMLAGCLPMLRRTLDHEVDILRYRGVVGRREWKITVASRPRFVKLFLHQEHVSFWTILASVATVILAVVALIAAIATRGPNPGAAPKSVTPSSPDRVAAVLKTPAPESTVRRCTRATGEIRNPLTDYVVWLVVRSHAEGTDEPGLLYLMHRLVPDTSGLWSVQPLSVGGDDNHDKGHLFWIQLYLVDVDHSGKYEADNWSDRGLDVLPEGFRLLSQTKVVRGVNNATGSGGFCAPNDGV
jgi:hypothetical protein